jgi:peptide methionine sulfoxide reductase msrA/msrB
MEKAIFASGCFWGVEYYFQKEPGVISTTVGYIGGTVENPTYEQVCSKKTGHAEAVLVEFNPDSVSYEELVRLFFETHDFTQINRQGPDIGEQYRSEIFYFDENQRSIAEKYLKILNDKGFNVATKLSEATTFWDAEKYHQDYYLKNGSSPYCHFKKKIFD